MLFKFLPIFMWLLLINDINGVTKTWICNTNADNRENWVSGNYMKNCSGLHFPKSLGDICLMSLGNITTSTIYLPETGDIEIRDNSDIVFSEESKDCIIVRDDLKREVYGDPKCWANENRAVPDLERSPCHGDDLVFPPNNTYSVELQIERNMVPKSIAIRNEIVSLGQLLSYNTYDSCPEFWTSIPPPYSSYDSRMCRANEYNYDCNRGTDWRQISCSSPVYVKGHCTLFCGSVFLVEAKDDFDIKRWFKKFFKNPSVDVYYSFIKTDSGSLVYQVTMTDKGEFTGDSTFLARRIYDNLKADLSSWNIRSLNASFSGLVLNPGKAFRNAVGILVGTLFAVIFLFGLMFAFYEGPLKDVNIIQRLPSISITKPSKRARKPFVFAKFENRDDGVTSICGSIVSLDKTFDNPMYGHQMASTSSGSVMEPVEEGEEMKEGCSKIVSKSEFANPLYGEDKIVVEDVDD
ncbi:hypothetical protein AMK59_1260 [Oryctes borbonicus]|uniref:Protein amnionless n=1 Tax=Oryctes borbonicus TaxID=1629725 RepID=A0A0T6BEK5_9SCAR|nr:hypothetical protein AMK59_1260 [Oryctes borbonicus]